MSLKKIIICFKWFPSAVLNKMNFKIRSVSYGHNLTTYGTIFLRGTGKINIGENVKITSCRETNPIGGDTKTILYTKGTGQINIGNNTGISNAAIIAIDRIDIGNNVMIGGNCKLYDHDFHSLNLEERMLSLDPGVKSKPIVISDGVFVGAHSIILKGVTIGERSVVGAGSVVTKSIPAGEVWAGNPAIFIKKLV